VRNKYDRRGPIGALIWPQVRKVGDVSEARKCEILTTEAVILIIHAISLTDLICRRVWHFSHFWSCGVRLRALFGVLFTIIEEVSEDS